MPSIVSIDPATGEITLKLNPEQYLSLVNAMGKKLADWQALKTMPPEAAAFVMDKTMHPMEGFMVIVLRDLLQQLEPVTRRMQMPDLEGNREHFQRLQAASMNFRIANCPKCGAGG